MLAQAKYGGPQRPVATMVSIAVARATNVHAESNSLRGFTY